MIRDDLQSRAPPGTASTLSILAVSAFTPIRLAIKEQNHGCFVCISRRIC